MKTLKEMKVFVPDDIHKDFRWAAQIIGHNVQQGLFSAVEDYIAKVKNLVMLQTTVCDTK